MLSGSSITFNFSVQKMDKKIAFGILLGMVFLAINVKAQPYLDSLNHQANRMLAAFTHGDYKTLLNFTHPKVVQFMGGKTAAESSLKASMQSLSATGFSFTDVKLGQPSPVIKKGQNYQCILPQFSKINHDGKALINKSNLLCISNNGGKNWYFINVDKSKASQLKMLIPELSPELIIPDSGIIPQ